MEERRGNRNKNMRLVKEEYLDLEIRMKEKTVKGITEKC